MDPYARAIGGRDVWGQKPDWQAPFQHRARVVFDDFDWEERPSAGNSAGRSGDLRDARARLHAPSVLRAGRVVAGTFAGLREKIPYLKELGVNCVELMPIYEFDEFENSRWDEQQQRWTKMNYWGYSTVGFFAPRADTPPRGEHGTAPWSGRIEEPGEGTAPQRHRGHPRRGVQPHGRGQRAGAHHLLSRHRQRHLLHAHPGGHYYNFSGTGQHAQLQQPHRAQHGAGLPALLGIANTTSTVFASTSPPSWAATNRGGPWPTRRCWRRWPSIRSWASAS